MYYCVDDFGKWPGLDQATMAAMEVQLIGRADRCVAASRVLQDRLTQFRPDVDLLTHGVDLEHWRQTAQPTDEIRLPKNGLQATFWGLIDRRLDTTWVRALAEHIHGRVRLVGPRDNPEKNLAAVSNLSLDPAVDYDELPVVAAASDVLIMPYVNAPVTRAMQPLKLLEYLATGKPVVVRDLPSTRPWADCLDVASSANEFVDLVAERGATGLPESQRKSRERLSSEDWSFKARQFERFVVGKDTHVPECCGAPIGQ